MLVYDDKTSTAVSSGTQLIIPSIHTSEDVIFKASYIVSCELKCQGKVTALFDLIVFGDFYADEIDVKGRFVCIGRCTVSGSIIVQNDIWCEDIQATSITCHDRIVAQSIDADSILADGNIIIGKTLAVGEKAQTDQNILCGETAYGSGKIIASSIITIEPLDLDDGEEALEFPFHYLPITNNPSTNVIFKETAKYEKNNDYTRYIATLMKNAEEAELKRLEKYATVLKTVEKALPLSNSEFRDAALLIWLIDISESQYFNNWSKIKEWTEIILFHFKNITEDEFTASKPGTPAIKLLKGYIINHEKFGTGVVEDIIIPKAGSNFKKMVLVKFDQYGKKKFPIPESLKFFSVISETELPASGEIKDSITCDITNYEEWLTALKIINDNKERLGKALYDAIFELLIEKIGLKAKFIETRFKEKGWN